MADKEQPATPGPKRPASPRALGVVTTTPIAFEWGGEVYLERMNLLSEEGAGVLSEVVPQSGQELQVAFRLSTAKGAVRCRARVVAEVPTTPAGARLRKSMGEKAFHSALRGSVGDSATTLFRLSDIEAAAAAEAAPAEAQQERPSLRGFSVQFVSLTATARALVQEHIAISRRLSEKTAVRDGAVVGLEADDGARMGAAFDDGDLSKRALDW